MAEVQPQTEAGESTQIFVEFVMMQAQNAALFLGQAPNPQSGQPEVNLPLAKMFIDQLIVIQTKTRGNLNRDEQRVIDSALSQLETAFIQMGGGGLHSSGITPGTMSSAGGGALHSAAGQPSAAGSAPVPAPEEGRKKFTKSYGA